MSNTPTPNHEDYKETSPNGLNGTQLRSQQRVGPRAAPQSAPCKPCSTTYSEIEEAFAVRLQVELGSF